MITEQVLPRNVRGAANVWDNSAMRNSSDHLRPKACHEMCGIRVRKLGSGVFDYIERFYIILRAIIRREGKYL